MNVINPAYAGSSDATSIGILYRDQWEGLEGAPKTATMNIHFPAGNNVGFGFSAISDEIGPVSETNLYVDFSYTLNLANENRLAFGIKAGGTFHDIGLVDLSLIDPNAEITRHSNNMNDWFSEFQKVDLDIYSDKMQYYDSLFYLPDDILHKVDRASMKYGLETRVPFLSKRIFKLAADLKYHQKYRIGSGKVILKKILEKYLPKHLIYRKKAGFGIPLDEWLRLDLKNWASDLINSDIKSLSFLDNTIYKKLWRDQLKGMNNSLPLWPYLIFVNWCKKHGYL